jgi:hypothetical protein
MTESPFRRFLAVRPRHDCRPELSCCTMLYHAVTYWSHARNMADIKMLLQGIDKERWVEWLRYLINSDNS